MTHSQSVVNKMFKLAKDEYEGRIPSHLEEIRQIQDTICSYEERIKKLEEEVDESSEFVDSCCKDLGFTKGFFKSNSGTNEVSLFLTRNDAEYAKGKTKYEWSQDERMQGRDLSVYGHIQPPRTRRS